MCASVLQTLCHPNQNVTKERERDRTRMHGRTYVPPSFKQIERSGLGAAPNIFFLKSNGSPGSTIVTRRKSTTTSSVTASQPVRHHATWNGENWVAATERTKFLFLAYNWKFPVEQDEVLAVMGQPHSSFGTLVLEPTKHWNAILWMPQSRFPFRTRMLCFTTRITDESLSPFWRCAMAWVIVASLTRPSGPTVSGKGPKCPADCPRTVTQPTQQLQTGESHTRASTGRSTRGCRMARGRMWGKCGCSHGSVGLDHSIAALRQCNHFVIAQLTSRVVRVRHLAVALNHCVNQRWDLLCLQHRH
jgi:hypothetical protein